jgi:hypothetical protein
MMIVIILFNKSKILGLFIYICVLHILSYGSVGWGAKWWRNATSYKSSMKNTLKIIAIVFASLSNELLENFKLLLKYTQKVTVFTKIWISYMYLAINLPQVLSFKFSGTKSELTWCSQLDGTNSIRIVFNDTAQEI